MYDSNLLRFAAEAMLQPRRPSEDRRLIAEIFAAAASPETVLAMLDAHACLERRWDELREMANKAIALAEHWKANHDNQVSRAWFLIERGDIPVEHVRAYEELSALRALAEAVRDHLAMHEGTTDEFKMSELTIAAALERIAALKKQGDTWT
jgi:hypothetical protein